MSWGKRAKNYLHKNAIESAHEMHRQMSITHCNDWIFFSFGYIIISHLGSRFKSKWVILGMAPIIWSIKETKTKCKKWTFNVSQGTNIYKQNVFLYVTIDIFTWKSITFVELSICVIMLCFKHSSRSIFKLGVFKLEMNDFCIFLINIYFNLN